jgi:Ran GTPase-activating protein (RanGAP) involved in mRNA processing and transport
MATEYAELNK